MYSHPSNFFVYSLVGPPHWPAALPLKAHIIEKYRQCDAQTYIVLHVISNTSDFAVNVDEIQVRQVFANVDVTAKHDRLDELEQIDVDLLHQAKSQLFHHAEARLRAILEEKKLTQPELTLQTANQKWMQPTTCQRWVRAQCSAQQSK